MKKLILFFFAVSVYAESNPYDKINKRNAFNLTSEKAPIPTLPPVTEILKPNVYLTGITRLNGVRKAHMVLRRTGQADKFISITLLNEQEGIELKKISKTSALISNNGQDQLISFENNGLPTIITKAAPPKKESSSRSSRDRRESSKKEEKKAAPAPAKAHIVQVPSRKPKIDPRVIEKGLEYINRIDDQEKREYIMKRLESLQAGQYKIKSDQDQNERRRQYDEWRKRRDSGK